MNLHLEKLPPKLILVFPKIIYKKMLNKYKKGLIKKKIGILGMAFKSDIDDTRDSLSMDLLNYLKSKKLSMKISDHFVNMKGIIKASELIKKSDVNYYNFFNSKYKNLKIPKKKLFN